MTITLSWNDFKTAYPDRGMVIFFVKNDSNDVTHIVVGLLNGSDKVMIFSNPPSKSNFLSEYPSSIQVNSIT